MPRISQALRILAAALVAVVLLPATSAGATIIHAPTFEIGGDPTPTETRIILGTWSQFTSTFSRSASCMTPLTVRVVDRAEDHFGSGTFAIAAFYKSSEATVYIEHGKVTPANLAHEFAHHLDVTCGIEGTRLAADFLAAAGFDESHPWYSGGWWSDVPAEQFSEAVLSWLQIGPVEIVVAPAAIDLIQILVWLGADGYERDHAPRRLQTFL